MLKTAFRSMCIVSSRSLKFLNCHRHVFLTARLFLAPLSPSAASSGLCFVLFKLPHSFGNHTSSKFEYVPTTSAGARIDLPGRDLLGVAQSVLNVRPQLSATRVFLIRTQPVYKELENSDNALQGDCGSAAGSELSLRPAGPPYGSQLRLSRPVRTPPV